MRAVLTLVIAAVAAALAGCQSSAPGGGTAANALPVLRESAASEMRLSAQEVNDAKKLYVAKCARCHKFYNPADYGETEWRSWMKKMGKKAVLNPRQEELLSRYLGAFRVAANVLEK